MRFHKAFEEVIQEQLYQLISNSVSTIGTGWMKKTIDICSHGGAETAK